MSMSAIASTGASAGLTTLVIGDLHLKQSRILPRVDEAVVRHRAGRVVFCGDYADDFGATDEDELRELKFMLEWVEQRRGDGLKVDVLLGNHDFGYLMGGGVSGFRHTVAPSVKWLLLEMQPVIAATVGDILVTHAGLTRRWTEHYLADALDAAGASGEQEGSGSDSASDTPTLAPLSAERARAALEALYAQRDAWPTLASVGRARGGWQTPGPLWADLSELAAPYNGDPVPGLRQIVGHTPVGGCMCLSDDPEIWACDTFSCYRDGSPIGDGSVLMVDEEGQVGSVPLL